MSRYPLLAGVLFWWGGYAQISEILATKSAGSISLLTWGLSSIVLFGYVEFYRRYTTIPAKWYGMGVSAVSGMLYAVIVILCLIYR